MDNENSPSRVSRCKRKEAAEGPPDGGPEVRALNFVSEIADERSAQVACNHRVDERKRAVRAPWNTMPRVDFVAPVIHVHAPQVEVCERRPAAPSERLFDYVIDRAAHRNYLFLTY